MRQARPFAARPAGIETAAALATLVARCDLVPAGTSWAPPGYEAADIRVLEWIAAHRRQRRVPAKTILAA